MESAEEVVRFAPDYSDNCEVCGQSPVVSGVNEKGKITFQGTMCGVCTWGEAACIDPTNW